MLENHRLTRNADKTEHTISCEPSENIDVKSYELHVNDEIIEHSNSVKAPGVFLDQNTTLQAKVKRFLHKLSSGLEGLYSIRDLFPDKKHD